MLRNRWLRWAVFLAAILLVASEGLSLLLRTAAPRRYLTARLESSFGRPVEVGSFAFSLLDGPRIEALNVSVAEDPRFGQEYFLRADQLIAGPSWLALLSGHFEFGTLSFTRPTLNLVRTSDGHWNLESWLPPAPLQASPGNRTKGAAIRAALHFHLSRIEVVTGRVNFKQDQNVRPMALEDVTGSLEQESPGRWQLDFEAQPMRSGVAQPQSGMVHVRGLVGGTSSRLQPADLNVSLSGATVEDALRLTRGRDYGIRGALSADLHASIESSPPGDATSSTASAVPAEWNISGVVRVAGIHLWNFPDKPGEPLLNVILNSQWRSGEPRVELTACDIQAPESVLHASGELAWNHGFHPQITLKPSDIGYNDLLAWYRSLHANVDDDLSIEGWLRAEGSLEDWPPRLTDASLESAGARIVPNATLPPMRFSRWNADLDSGELKSSVVVAQFEPAGRAASATHPSELRLQASLLAPQDMTRPAPRSARPTPRNARDDGWHFRVSVDGTADRVQDYLALGRAFGSRPAPLWSAQGSLAFNVNGEGDFHRGSTDWQGTVESHNLSLQLAFFNEPLILPDVTLALGAGASDKITLSAAQAFDTTWSGTIFRNAAHPAWQFDLTTDRLDTAALDSWLEPHARPVSLLERLGLVAPDQDSSGPELTAAIATIPIAARGRLRVSEFTLAPLHLAQVDADVELAGKTIDVHRAKASFAGGTIDASLTAALGPHPLYDARAHFDRVDLATLGLDVPALAGKFDGLAGGDVTLHSAGIGRDALLDSLDGAGTIDARNLQITGFNLSAMRAAPNSIDEERFTQAQATFRIADRTVRASPVRLSKPGENLVAVGTVDFEGALDFRVVAGSARPAAVRPAGSSSSPNADASSASGSSGAFRLTGSVESPQLAPYPPPAAPPAAPKPDIRGIRGALR